MADLDKKTPLEKAEKRKRLHAVPHSLDVLLVTSAVLFGFSVFAVGFNWGGILAGLVVVVALFLNNYLMYNAAYRDGFRSGYATAMEDSKDVGFVPERMDDHQVYTRFGELDGTGVKP